MRRSLTRVIESLSPEIREQINNKTKKLILEVAALRLKQLRYRWGISQQELAKVLNNSQSAISNLADRHDI